MSHLSDRGERAGEEVACTQTVVRRAQNRNKRLTLMTDARFSSLESRGSSCFALVVDHEQLATLLILPARPQVRAPGVVA